MRENNAWSVQDCIIANTVQNIIAWIVKNLRNALTKGIPLTNLGVATGYAATATYNAKVAMSGSVVGVVANVLVVNRVFVTIVTMAKNVRTKFAGRSIL